VSVVVGRFAGVQGLGLNGILRSDCRVRVLAKHLEDRELEDTFARWEPEVAILSAAAELAVVERLHRERPQTGMLVLIQDPSRADGMRLLAAGANCAALSAPGLDLVEAVQRTARGERFFLAAGGERIERRYPAHAEPLTERETEVLSHLTLGRTHRQIALALDISVRTAEKHAATILRKLGEDRKSELVGMPMPPQGAATYQTSTDHCEP
jgi:DNA-binding NarL/FixJ family response regulator